MPYERPTPKTPGSATAALLVPLACYGVFLRSAAKETSKSSGARMLTLDCQIVTPDKVTNANGTVSNTAGVEGKCRIVFTPDNLGNCIDALTKCGVTLPPPGVDFESDVAGMIDAAAEQLPGNVIDMTLVSKVESKTQDVLVDGKVTRIPMTDSRGQVIVGREQCDFNMFSIVGNLRSLSEAGVNAY